MSDQFISFLCIVIEGKAKTKSAIKICKFSEAAHPHPLNCVWFIFSYTFLFFPSHVGLKTLRICSVMMAIICDDSKRRL